MNQEKSTTSTFQDRLAAFARGHQPKSTTSELTGVVSSVKMFNAEWGRATLLTEDGTEVKLTGGVQDLVEWNEYSITGQLKKHPKYGDSYDVLAAKPYFKANPTAMIKFIKNNFKGIGEVSAKKFVAAAQAAGGAEGLALLREQLLNEPWAVDFSIIKRDGTFDSAEDDKTMRAFIKRDLATRFNNLNGKVLTGLSDFLFAKVRGQQNANRDAGKKSANPVTTAWSLFAQNPYAPIAEVAGYSFTSADVIARSVNIPADAPMRLAALVAHAVDERCATYGHVYLTQEQARQGIVAVDSRVNPVKALEQALAQESIQIDDEFGEMRIYPGKLLEDERNLAKNIATLCDSGEPLVSKSGQDLVDRIQTAAKSLGGVFKDGMDQSQLNALYGMLTSTSRVHTVTAEPGAGKTAVMEVLAKFLPRHKFLFCAPTGKGAKVLSNRVRSIGAYASTIHSLLKGEPTGGFQFNKDKPLEGDILVVDEGSMPSTQLAAAVFAAVGDGMHVIVLGDVNQLPSIEPGRVLADLLDIPEVDHHRLTEVHRNSGGILDVVREVKSGRINPTDRDGVRFSGSLPPCSIGMQAVVSEYIEAVDRDGYEGTALIMSRRQGEVNEPGWNTTYANAVLRDICNPGAEKLPGSTIQVGDRIIIKENMTIQGPDDTEERVVNGDTGTLMGFTKKGGDRRSAGVAEYNLKLDDGRSIDMPGDTLSTLQLSYALTVHAAQGSEYKNVIAVITPGAPTFINRGMAYTGFSRARNSLSVHANNVDLQKIVATPMPARNSGLVQRVQQALGYEDVQQVAEAEIRATQYPTRQRRAA